MKKLIYLSAAICLLMAAQACRDSKKAKNFNQKTQVDQHALKFIIDANEASAAEIQAGTLAEKTSKNPRVINYAKMMIADHTDAGNELKKIAADKYVTITDTVSVAHKMMLDSLSKKTGADFDKGYMLMMVADHRKVMDMFVTAGKDNSITIQKYSEKTIPKLKMHLDSAKAISASLK